MGPRNHSSFFQQMFTEHMTEFTLTDVLSPYGDRLATKLHSLSFSSAQRDLKEDTEGSKH